ncbi:hypothetical protein JT054_01725, partial [Helicobacter pylori]|nr:hypothetical protein [Helicobacter pylori]
DSIYSLKNIVAKNLNFDKATHPNVGDSNLALLMYNMPRTKTQVVTKDLLRLMCFLRPNHLQHP